MMMIKLSQAVISEECRVDVLDKCIEIGHLYGTPERHEHLPGTIYKREELDLLVKYLQSVQLWWKPPNTKLV
jgi:hypothetical protein